MPSPADGDGDAEAVLLDEPNVDGPHRGSVPWDPREGAVHDTSVAPGDADGPTWAAPGAATEPTPLPVCSAADAGRLRDWQRWTEEPRAMMREQMRQLRDAQVTSMVRRGRMSRHSVDPRRWAWVVRVDWFYWANVLYLIGSVAYVFTATYCWQCVNSVVLCNLINIAAALNYVADALCYMLAGYIDLLETEDSKLSGLLMRSLVCDAEQDDPLPRVADGRSRPPAYSVLSDAAVAAAAATKAATALRRGVYFAPLHRPHRSLDSCWAQGLVDRVTRIDWNFYGNLFFMLPAMGYTITAVMWALHEDTEKQLIYETIDTISSHLYVLDAVLYTVSWWLFRRDNRGTAQETRLFVCSIRELDWCGWGNILFIIGSFCYAANSWICINVGDSATACNVSNLLGAVLFLVDSALFFVADAVSRRTRPI